MQKGPRINGMEQDLALSSREVRLQSHWPMLGGFVYLRWGIALLLVLAISQLVNFREAVELMGGVDIRYFASIVILALFDRYLMAYKWAMLLRTRGAAISNGEAFRIYLAAGVIATVVPLGVSADIFKLGRTTQAGTKLEKATASIIVERAIGCLAVVVLAAIGLSLLVLLNEEQFLYVYYVAGATFAALVTGFVILCLPCGYRWLSGLLLSVQRYRVAKLILNSFRECIAISRQRRLLSWFFILSLFEQCVRILMNYLAGKALGFSINASYFFAIIPVSSLLVALPISINVIGVTEGVYILLFSLAGVSATQSLSLSLAMRAVGLIVLIPSVFVFLYDSGSFRRARRVHDPM